jgi:eukaryotic-like serine/threonine-protein kinase
MHRLVGQVLQGRYLLEEYIDEGNFGAVYRSTQQFLGSPVRRVAVKISKQTQMDAETAQRIFADVFLLARAMDEMQDLAARGHLVNVFEAGLAEDQENRAYVVMEFVQGTTLGEQFKRMQNVPGNLLLKWARQICKALSGLHTLMPAVIHRDLKPDNILLGVDNNVRVVDFGLAARLLDLGYVPGTAGTTAYMAPETSIGEGISTPASDVYSLGILLYEGLTGERPFQDLVTPIGHPEALEAQWLYDQKSRLMPPFARSKNNSVTPDLDSAVRKCLAFRAGDRFLNARELLEALESIAPVEGSGAGIPETGGDRTGSPEEKRQALAASLDRGCLSAEDRFANTRELGLCCAEVKDYMEAATHLVQAWEMTRNSAFLRSKKERMELLSSIESVYRKMGNTFQENYYRRLIQDESGGIERKGP